MTGPTRFNMILDPSAVNKGMLNPFGAIDDALQAARHNPAVAMLFYSNIYA